MCTGIFYQEVEALPSPIEMLLEIHTTSMVIISLPYKRQFEIGVLETLLYLFFQNSCAMDCMKTQNCDTFQMDGNKCLLFNDVKA